MRNPKMKSNKFLQNIIKDLQIVNWIEVVIVDRMTVSCITFIIDKEEGDMLVTQSEGDMFDP